MSYMSTETIESFRRVPIFRDLGEADHLALAETATRRRVARGDMVFAEDTPSLGIYVIERGDVEVSKALPEGGRKVIARLGAGECFGELSVICDYPHSATVTATTECEVLVLEKQAFQALLMRMPSLSSNLLKILAQRLRGAAGNTREFNAIALEIEKLSGEIGSVANQTHILAINATIEAGRAGDLGRGFGVVAQEMRRLADRSQTAVGKIKGLASQIRSRAR